MTTPDQRSTSELKPGQMPIPRFFPVTIDGRVRSFVGIEAFSVDGKVKTFIWFTNLTAGSLADTEARRHYAETIMGFKLRLGIDAAIGPAIDIRRSSFATGHVEADSNLPGLYIEKDKRFQYRSEDRRHMQGLSQVLRINPEARATLQKALALLPYLPQQTAPRTS